MHDCLSLHVDNWHLCSHVKWFRSQNKHLDDLLHLFCKCSNVWHFWHWLLDQYSQYLIVWYVNLAAKTHFFRCFYASTSILNISIIEAWFFLALFSSFDNHIELIINFNSKLYFSSSILRYLILIFMLKILIFRLCITILYHFSFFLILLTLNICFHIYLCFNKAFAMYFFEIVKAILLSFCVLVTVTTIMSNFVFFSALFTALRIFITCKIQFSFFEVIINLLSRYDISCDFDESFLIIRFYLPAFAFTFAFVFAFAFALVTWAAFCIYVSFCVGFCEFCMICNICKICVFCKICEFFVICFALIFFLMFSTFC